MSNYLDIAAYEAAYEASRRLHAELLRIAERKEIDTQTSRALRLYALSLEPHQRDLRDLISHLQAAQAI